MKTRFLSALAWACTFACSVIGSAHAQVAISALPNATLPLACEATPIVQSGATKQTPACGFGIPVVSSTAPTPVARYQEYWDSSTTPVTLRQWDGVSWVPIGTLDLSAHVWASANSGLTPTIKAPQSTGVAGAASDINHLGTSLTGGVLVSTIGWPASGEVRADNEYMGYKVLGSAITITSRGDCGSTGVAHANGTSMLWVNVMFGCPVTGTPDWVLMGDGTQYWNGQKVTGALQNFTGNTGPTQITGAETSVASAATVDLSAVTTPKVQITGTTDISAFTMPAHALFFLRFGGVLNLVYNATSLILPGNESIKTQAGDTALVSTDASGNARMREYVRAARTPDDGAVPNLLRNPEFQIWQENTTYSPACSSTATFIADGWKALSASGCAAASRTWSRVAGFSGGQFALKWQRTATNTDVQVSRFSEQISTADAISLQGKTLHLSCDLQTGANLSPAVLTISLITGTGTDESFNLNGTSFTTGSVTTNFSASTYAISASTTVHADFGTVAFPSNATEAAVRLTWTPSGTAGADDSLSFTNCNLTVSGGDVPYVHPSFEESLRRAQFAYRKSFVYATAPAQNVGAGTGEFIFGAGKAGAAAELTSVPFGGSMRAAPSVTLFNPAAANAQCRDETAGADGSSSSAANITEKGFEITCTGNASTAVGGAIATHWAADARL